MSHGGALGGPNRAATSRYGARARIGWVGISLR